MLNEIQALHSEMVPLLVRAGISEKSIAAPIHNMEHFTEPELLELHAWLTQVRQKEYKELHRIFKLPDNDDLWDLAKEYGIVDLPEHALFAAAAKKLRTVWHNPYRPARRIRSAKVKGEGDSHGNSENPEPVGVQSEGDRPTVSDCGSTPG